MWQADKSPDAPGRLENLKELVVAMAEFENLGGFLEHVSLVMDNAADSAGDMVNLMTLHSAKGLEFDTVFLPGWEEGVFPSQRAIEETGLNGLEEERRLAYVGLTRARRRAFVSFAANRQIHGKWQSAARSRFIDELPDEHIEVTSEMGLGAAPAWGNAAWGGAAAEVGAGDRHLRRLGRRLGEGAGRARPARPLLIESGRGAAARPGDPAGRRLCGRRPRVPPEIRLRHGPRRRGQQARDRFRAGRRQEGHGRLRRAGLNADEPGPDFAEINSNYTQSRRKPGPISRHFGLG